MNINLQYSGLHLDRGDLLRRSPDALARLWQHENCRIIPLLDNRNLFTLDMHNRATDAALYTRAELETYLEQAQYCTFLGHHNDEPYFTFEIHAQHQETLTRQLRSKFIDLRSIGAHLNQQTASLLAYARAMVHWQRHNRFCSLCGSPLNTTYGGHILQCSNETCGHQVYPRTDPAVIMLVQRTNAAGVKQCLLGRHPNWQAGSVSTLAGFVEPGESLEEAVRREVAEESGILTGNVQYIASQPWPFPSSIMLGFFADAISSEIILDTHELAEAHWFSKAELENFGEWGEDSTCFKLPRRDSIARFLINHWMSIQ